MMWTPKATITTAASSVSPLQPSSLHAWLHMPRMDSWFCVYTHSCKHRKQGACSWAHTGTAGTRCSVHEDTAIPFLCAPEDESIHAAHSPAALFPGSCVCRDVHSTHMPGGTVHPHTCVSQACTSQNQDGGKEGSFGEGAGEGGAPLARGLSSCAALTPVREVPVVAVFFPSRQWVQVVATAAVVDHVVLETGVKTGLGVQNRSQAWWDGPTPVPE